MTNGGTSKEKAGFGGGLFDLFNSDITTESAQSGKYLAFNREWVYRNNKVIADEVSNITLELFSTKVVNGTVELTKLDVHPALIAIDRMNDATAKSEGFYMTQSYKKLVGDAFWYIEGTKTNVKNIYPLDPTKVDVLLGDFTSSGGRLIIGYQYKDTVNGKPIDLKFDPEEIIMFKNPDPENMIRGLGAIKVLSGTIDLDNLTIDVTKNFLKRGAISNFVLTTDQKITPEEKKRMRAEFRANYGGYKNSFKAMILGGGLKPESIQMTNKDMEFLAQLEWYRDKIMVVFGNTKSALGIVEDVNRSNAEATLSGWKRNTIVPEMKSLVDTLNEFYLPRFGSNLVFGFKNPVPEDKSDDVDQAQKLYTAGIINQNEAREMVGFDEVDGGDDFRGTTQVINPNNEEELPKSLRNIDYRKAFRNLNIYKPLNEQRQKIEMKNIAKGIVKARTKKKAIVPISNNFTDEEIRTYWEKQINIVDQQEVRIENAAYQYSELIVEDALSNIDNESARKDGELVDRERLEDKALGLFQPLFTEVVIASGNEANQLIGIDSPYIPKQKAVDIRSALRIAILKFAGSMIDTDLKIITETLAIGLEQGLGIPEIRRQLQEKFFGKGKESKIQAERVARTETLRASQLGTEDAYKESGVVAAKQWLSELDDRTSDICEELDGKIVDLDTDFVEKGGIVAGVSLDYGPTPYPPAHPNCRSVLIPVLVGGKSYKADKIRELEKQIDKRTKEFKQLEAKDLEKDEYISELEKLLGLNDE